MELRTNESLYTCSPHFFSRVNNNQYVITTLEVTHMRMLTYLCLSIFRITAEAAKTHALKQTDDLHACETYSIWILQKHHDVQSTTA